MKRWLGWIVFTVIVTIILLLTCSVFREIKTQPASYDSTITLHWIQNYKTETKEDFEEAFVWGLSFLGAELPKDSLSSWLVWKDSNTFILHFEKAGFSTAALVPINKVLYELKRSEEYLKTKRIDAGRLMVQLLNNSSHYYAITGVAKTFDGFRNQYEWDPKKAAIIESVIAKKHRKINFSKPTGNKLAFFSEESGGSLLDSTFRTSEFEVSELMPNGQFRYAIYDTFGNLKIAADSSKTSAGKPAKCIWCHEISIQPTYIAKTNVQNYYTFFQFDSIVAQRYLLAQKYRKTLRSDLDFSETQKHTLLEKLYISFMEPSLRRVALEWSMDSVSVSKKINRLPTHEHHEFKDLGLLYDRKEIDEKAPYSSLPVPGSARDLSDFEPNYLSKE